MNFLNEDIKRILFLMEIKNNKKVNELELDEDETASDTSSGGETTNTTSSSYPSVHKWSSNRKFGKTYMNDPKYKWTSDITKGKGNKTATEKWSSGRTYGPTGNYNT